MKPKDFLGNELSIVDEVVYINSYYRCLEKGVITAFTPQNVRIGSTIKTIRPFYNVVKIN